MRRLVFTLLLLIAGFAAQAQRFSNDFENQYTWYPPWLNLRIVADSTALEGQFVCVCDSTMDYGLGIAIEAGKQYPRQNINIQYEFLFKTDAELIPDKLLPLARARLEHPESSLSDLGDLLRPQVSKSTVKYRLAKLRAIAEEAGFVKTENETDEEP